MAEILAQRTTADWLERMDAAEVPCAPVLTREELIVHPQILANELVVESDHPIAGRMRQARPAARFEDTPSDLRRPAAALGQHTDEVLREAGLQEEEISALCAADAIR